MRRNVEIDYQCLICWEMDSACECCEICIRWHDREECECEKEDQE